MRLRSRGFSLVEIMFVIVIVGILGLMGVGQFRRMQDNNEFNSQVQGLGGEIRALAMEAKSLGVEPSASAGSGTTNRTATGKFQWRVFRNGQKIKEGQLGVRQDLTLTYTANMAARSAGSVGSWLQIDQLVPNGAPQPVLQVIWRPDGTPLDPGEILLRNRNHGQRIKIRSQGAVEGPTAE